jgi:hypothetical protein
VVEQEKLERRIIELLNAEIDDELSPAEKCELQEILAESAAARAARDEFQSLNKALGGLPQVEPPEYLQESIERQVRLPASAAVGSDSQLTGWLSSNWLRAGAALAAGVVLTVAVVQVGNGPIPELDEQDIVGTVIQPRDSVLLDKAAIANELFIGRVELRESEDFYLLNLHLASTAKVDTTVNFSGLGLEFVGLGGAQGEDALSRPENGIVVISSLGKRDFGLKLRPGRDTLEERPAAMELEFFVNGSLVEETSLRFQGRKN